MGAYGQRLGGCGRRVGAYGQRLGGCGRRVGAYGQRLGAYGLTRDPRGAYQPSETP
ncbi:hypothetical protein GCM10007298_26340 [Williamsia phyllosphaerae]|uniref:Uncharacterized protein n=1 Tax=Williamsia phyllosphaerae TaxID=885042 RepID=A0ABQ1UYA8_9NOCA|nr:hypothetical protein GCM10007298_26340 [Williamsia phyllosphaerae]